jgi:flagellar motor switch protein FliG
MSTAPTLPEPRQPEALPRNKSAAAMSGLRKAAILLVILGEESASEIYKNLQEPDLRRVTQAIVDLGYVSPEMALQVLQEYQQLVLTQDYLAEGGFEYANQLLVKAFGQDGAHRLLDQVSQAREAVATNLDSLQKADPQQLVKFIEGEHPQTVALVLAHLGKVSASSLLVLMPEKLRAEAVRRLAEMQQFSTEMVKKISLVLHKKIAGLGTESRRAYGGVNSVAEMLNSVDPTTSLSILESIEQDNPKLALSIRNLMFTFEDLLTVPEATIREILAQTEKKTLGMALKGSNENLRNHFYKCMSTRAVEMLKEDMEAMGPVRARQVQQAQQDIVNLARKLESEGKISLKSGGDDAYVV